MNRRIVNPDPSYLHGCCLAAQAMAMAAARLAAPDPEPIRHEMLESLERLRVAVLPSEAGDGMLRAIDEAEQLVLTMLGYRRPG